MAENDVMGEYARTCMTLNVNNVNLNVSYSPQPPRVQRKKNPRSSTNYETRHLRTSSQLSRYVTPRDERENLAQSRSPFSNSMSVLIRSLIVKCNHSLRIKRMCVSFFDCSCKSCCGFIQIAVLLITTVVCVGHYDP